MDKITQLQTLLKEQGYKIEADGNWGPKSKEAYESFKLKNSIMGPASNLASKLNPVTALYNSIPLNVRSLAEDVAVPNSISKAFPRTEHDLDSGELEALRRATRTATEDGRRNIKYADYKTHLNDDGTEYQTPTADVDPTSGNTWDMFKKTMSSEDYNAKTTYGRASIFIPPGTTDTLFIDQYNFNNAVSDDMSAADKASQFAKTSGAGYSTPRNIGTYWGSKNGEGKRTAVNISEKRTGGMDTYRNGGMKYYQNAGVDDSTLGDESDLYDNDIPQGYSSGQAVGGSYNTRSNTIQNSLYTPGDSQDLDAQKKQLLEDGPDSSAKEAEISRKNQMLSTGLDKGLELVGATEPNPIDMVSDRLISDQDAGTYKWWEVAGDVGTAVATGDYIGGIKDVAMKWKERNEIKSAKKMAQGKLETKTNTLANKSDLIDSQKRMQSGINFGQDFSSNIKKYEARTGGRGHYETGGPTQIAYEQFNRGVNKNTGAINQSMGANADGTRNNWNTSLYGGNRITPDSNVWEGEQYDANGEKLFMDGATTGVDSMESRMGLSGANMLNGKYTDPNYSASGRERSDYRKNRINNNNYRRDLFKTRQNEMKNNTSERVSQNNPDSKFNSKGTQDIMSSRDARRMEKFGNTKSGIGNFFSNIFKGKYGYQGNEMATGGRPLPGGEVVDLPSGAKKYIGATHEEGGIDKNSRTNVEDQETEEEILGKPYIFSSHLKNGGSSYAQQHEKILANGGTDEEKISLAVTQEKQAGRDPKKLFMKNGGSVRNKYSTGGALSGMTGAQRRQYFIDSYGYDAGANADWGDTVLSSPPGPGNSDNEITLPTNPESVFNSPAEESVATNKATEDITTNAKNESNKLTWDQQLSRLKKGLTMDNAVGLASMIPVAQAYKNAKNVDRVKLPGTAPEVTPEKLKYGNMDKERAQNERDYQKVVNFVQTQGGSLSDQMAAYSKKLDANADIGSAENEMNRGIDNQNAKAIFEAAKFNAQGDMQDVSNQMMIDDTNLASKSASEDALVDAMQVGAENLGVMNRDRKLQNASDRLSAAIDGGSGVLMREKYGKEDYENLVTAARTGDLDALKKLEEWSIELNAEMGQKDTNQKGTPRGK